MNKGYIRVKSCAISAFSSKFWWFSIIIESLTLHHNDRYHCFFVKIRNELTGRKPHAKIRSCMPPSSSGPGRSPLKAKTGVRFPLGVLKSLRIKPERSFLNSP